MVAAAILVATVACGKDQVTVHDERSGDFGRARVLVAVEQMSKTPDSPVAYRNLVLEVEKLRPGFSHQVADEADRSLVFLAVGPLELFATRPGKEQLEALALTVWPTVLGVEPVKGESPQGYIERVCGESLARKCKRVVPEYWPLMVGALVWSRFKDRARQAYAGCVPCQDQPGYLEVVKKFEARDAELTIEVGNLKKEVRPSAWPIAGQRADPWQEAPLLERRRDGTLLLDGREIEPEVCRKELEERRGGDSLLAVHLHPQDKAEILRAMLDDAGKAGYSEVVLQVRLPEYPYQLRGYRLVVGRNARKAKQVKARDVESVQVVVRMIDALCGGPGPLRL